MILLIIIALLIHFVIGIIIIPFIAEIFEAITKKNSNDYFLEIIGMTSLWEFVIIISICYCIVRFIKNINKIFKKDDEKDE